MQKLLFLLLPFSLFAAAPSAPSNLHLTPSSHSVHITWQDNSNNETGFKIIRDGQLIHTTGANVRSYTDSNLLSKHRYRYLVKATNDVQKHTSIQAKITDYHDDAEESSNGHMHLESSDLEMTQESSKQVVGVRFPRVNIPQGVTITSAYIQFTTKETASTRTNLTINVQNSTNPSTFGRTTHNISSRALLAQTVSWNPPAWNVANEKSPKQRTPNLAALVQGIVSQSAWRSNRPMAFVIKGTGKRVAFSYDGNHNAAPVLHITYSSNDQGNAGDGVIINEVLPANVNSNLDPDFGNFSDWIELYNTESYPFDIGGFYLSDDAKKPTQWKIPEGTNIPAHGYILVWADKEDTKKSALHTNFKLSQKGETITLSDEAGNPISSLTYGKIAPSISVTKQNNTIRYMQASPNRANSAGYSTQGLSSSVAFSRASAFVPANTSISLSGASNIHYTTNGSIPTINSTRYTRPITLTTSTVIRAISFTAGKLPSTVTTNSYLIGESNTNLPVISLAIDNRYLFDNTIGIYTKGTNGKAVTGCGAASNGIIANYMQKWERPAHMTFFEENKVAVLNQDMGLKLAGQCSRNYNQKSFNLKADNKYGKKDFAHQVFPDKPFKKFKKIKLRNAGQDVSKTHFRDALGQIITKGQMHLNYEAYRPALVFINGKYWGIFNIREKMGAEYITNNYGVKKKKIDMLKDDGDIEEGDTKDYDALFKYITDHSLATQTNYNYVTTKMDMDNYIDYMIANFYVANSDWPGTNLIYWKEKKAGKKWQWLLHDLDFGFANYRSISPVSYNSIAKAKEINNGDWPNPEWSTRMFRKLLENPGFKSRFRARMTSLLNTTFAPNRTKSVLDTFQSKIQPEIARHLQKWPRGDRDTEEEWLDEVDRVRTFMDQRPAILRSHLNGL